MIDLGENYNKIEGKPGDEEEEKVCLFDNCVTSGCLGDEEEEKVCLFDNCVTSGCLGDLISTKEAAQILGVSQETLKQWRTRRIFGVRFFPADVKDKGAWYYYRERVEQLKEVYNKGNLQNVYTASRNNLSDDDNETIYYEGDEVAEILGVNKATLTKWRQTNYFSPNFIGHEGTYYYSSDRVKKLVANRQVLIAPAETNIKSEESTPVDSSQNVSVNQRKQELQNLPEELLRQARFFRVGRMFEGKWNQKAPVDKWNNCDNQKKFDELQYTDERQMAGFDIVGHGKGADYLVADFDHVLNADGTFKNSDVGDWLSALCTSTYWEKSFSGDGYHVLFKPADDEFPALASGKSACLDFGDDGKIELFYKPNGRYFLLTGWVQSPQNANAEISADCEVVHDLLKEIATKNSVVTEQKENVPAQHFSINVSTDNPPEYEKARIEKMLELIPPAELLDNEWLAVVSSLKNLEVPYSVIDEWNKRDAERYNERENLTRVNSLSDSTFGIGTIHSLAKRFGYVEKDFKRQWFKENPQFDAQIIKAQEYGKRIGKDFIPKEFFDKIYKQFEDSESLAQQVLSLVTDFFAGEIRADYDLLRDTGVCEFKELSEMQEKSVEVDDAFFIQKVASSSIISYSAAIAQISNDTETRSAYVNFYDAIKKAKKFRLGVFNNFVKECIEKIELVKKSVAGLRSRSTAIFKAAQIATDDGLVYPTRNYLVGNDGIMAWDKRDDWVEITHRPIKITALYRRNEDDTRLVDLWTIDTDGKDLVIDCVEKDIISDARKITSLSARGLDVISKHAAAVVQYLSEFIDVNKEKLKLRRMHTKLGWYNNETNFFIVPTDDRFKIDKNRAGNFAQALKIHGDFEIWKETAREIMKYPVAEFILAASFSVPLLKICGERSFSIYLFSDSKSGKSAVVRFAGSVWGNKKVVKNLRATKNGIETELAECSDFPAIYDEKQLAENLDMSQLAYLIGNEEGKGRSTPDATAKKRWQWRTIGILTGEEPMHWDAKTQGAITRCMTFFIDAKKIIPDDLSKKIYEVVVPSHYGHAGKFFMDNLLEHFKDDFSHFREIRQAIIAKIHESTKQKNLIDEYCRYIATVAVGNYLMKQILFGIDDATAINSAVTNALEITKLLKSERELSDVTREWEFVSGWIAENAAKILGNPAMSVQNIGGTVQPVHPSQIIGEQKSDNLFIISKSLNTALQLAGYNPAKVINDLAKAGYIDKSKSRITQLQRINNVPTRVYQIKLADENSEKDENFKF